MRDAIVTVSSAHFTWLFLWLPVLRLLFFVCVFRTKVTGDFGAT